MNQTLPPTGAERRQIFSKPWLLIVSGFLMVCTGLYLLNHYSQRQGPQSTWKRPGTMAEAGRVLTGVDTNGVTPPKDATAKESAAIDSLSSAEQKSFWAAVSAARRGVTPLSAHEAAMPQNEGVRYFAANPGQKLSARFLDGAVRVESTRGGDWQGTLRFAGVDGETDLATAPRAEKERVEYQHPGGITEWYLNRADGIEHGFTVATRPAQAANSGELELNMELDGLRAESAEEGLQFVNDATGQAVVGYGGLKVWDASGKTLAARLEPRGSTLAILVSDSTAAYPITIDPLIVSLEAKIGAEVTGVGAPSDAFGNSVALSGDRAIVGVAQDTTAGGVNAGSVYLFVRAGGQWSQEARVFAGEPGTGQRFGSGVSISGETAVVAASGTVTGGRVAYVFVRNETGWLQQAKLTSGETDPAIESEFANSVALSGDTLLVGSRFSIEGGRVHVFVRESGVWTRQARFSAAADEYVPQRFGAVVAISGETAVVGAPFSTIRAIEQHFDETGKLVDARPALLNVGAAYVFVRSGNTWSQQARLAGDGDESDQFASAVAIDGDTILTGTRMDNANTGSVRAFVRQGSSWIQEALLTASDAAIGDFYGQSVGILGNTAVVGSSADDTPSGVNAGSVYVYGRNGGVWSQQSHITAVGGSFGGAIAMSGETVLVGAAAAFTSGGQNAGSAYVFVRDGATWTQQAQFDAGDSGSSDLFGITVALFGETALIGANQDSTAAGANVGSAYIFVRSESGWAQQAKLTASDGAASDNFGVPVALWGDTAMVGARNDDTPGGVNAGSVYVFVRNGEGWIQQAQLMASDGAANDGFGSVAIAGDIAVIGSSSDDTTAGLNAGSAYIFARNGSTWSEQTKLTAADAAANDFFGGVIAFDGGTALISASGDDTEGGVNAGSVYVFLRDGASWTQQARLTAADGAANDAFGVSVALSGETALIGASQDDTPLVNAGSAYVFVRTGSAWSQQAHLIAADGAAGDAIANSVALYGDTALVAARNDDTAVGVDAGSAYVFVRTGNTWTQEAKLTAPDAAAGDVFGSSVALFGETAIVGAAADDTTDPEQVRFNHGSAYLFQLSSDFAPPTITLQGPNPMYLECAAEYVEVGAIVTDDRDPNPSLVISGSVNAQLPGSYTVTYTATDASGKSSAVARSVVVVAPMPVINAINPVSAVANGPDLVLHLNGSCFASGAVVRWNASAYAAVFENNSALAVTIPASEFATSADLLLVNVSVENPSGGISNPQVFAITNPNMGELESGVALAGGSVSISTAPVAEGQAGLVAVASNNGGDSLLIAGGTYAGAPPSGLVFGSGGVYYDLVVFGADPEDAAGVSFYYPSSVTGSTENQLRLTWFNDTTWLPVKGAGNSSPEKDTADNQDGTVSGGRFTVILDNTSSPKLTELSGTVFGLAATQPLVNITASAAPMAVNMAATIGISYQAIGAPDSQQVTVDWGDGAVTSEVPSGSGETSASHLYTEAGVYTLLVTVTDANGDAGTAAFHYIVVYDPSAGFVTGGGWINSPLGAYTPNPNLVGKASFGFNSKYKNGATVPEGNTEFQFKAGDLNFKSTVYEWLVVSGARGQFKGSGKINGQGSYDFKLTAIDGQVQGGGGADRFRMKIWDRVTGGVVYDNQLNAPDDAALTDSTAIGGGSIVLHKQ